VFIIQTQAGGGNGRETQAGGRQSRAENAGEKIQQKRRRNGRANL